MNTPPQGWVCCHSRFQVTRAEVLEWRLLFAIPHYFDPDPGGRAAARVARPRPRPATPGADRLPRRPPAAVRPAAVRHRHRPPDHHPRQPRHRATADVVVCTTGGKHLLDRLPLGARVLHPPPDRRRPALLGFECHAALRDRLAAGYDYLLLPRRRPAHPRPAVLRQAALVRPGSSATRRVLMPNRYEVARDRIVHKAYIDGPIRPGATAAFQDVTDAAGTRGGGAGSRVAFRRTTNPHSGGVLPHRRADGRVGRRSRTSSTATRGSSARWRAPRRSA